MKCETFLLPTEESDTSPNSSPHIWILIFYFSNASSPFSLSLSLTPNRYMTRRLALNLIALGWLVGLTIAAIPLIWNKWEYAQECEFDEIFYPWYMVGVITPIFSLVWLVMLFVYCRIWREASKQVKQLRTQGQQEGSDWKSVQVSSKISNWIFFLLFFVKVCKMKLCSFFRLHDLIACMKIAFSPAFSTWSTSECTLGKSFEKASSSGKWFV